MTPLSFLFGRESNGLFAPGKNCVITTLTTSGVPRSRKLRVGTCSEDGAHLWFVIPKGRGVASDIARDSNVMLTVLNAGTGKLVHVSGAANVLSDRVSPLYLAPDFQQPRALSVVIGEMDFALLCVEVDEQDLAEERRPPNSLFGVFQNSLWLAQDRPQHRGTEAK
jgi:hypothetical protein